MSSSQLLAELLQKGIQLWVEEGQLGFRGPKGAITPALRQAISQHKAEMIARLGNEGHKYALTSYAQQRLWFLEQFEPGQSVYNIPLCHKLEGPLQLAALEKAFVEIVQRHEALRTTFVDLDGRPFQVIHPTCEVKLEKVSFEHYPATSREAEARQWLSAEVRRPFDLGRGPLVRAVLLQLECESHLLFLNFHHIIADAWSIELFFGELRALYAACLANEPVPLPPISFQYADFALWQQQHLQQGEILESQLAYWEKKLEGPLPTLEIPGDHPRPARLRQQGTYYSFTLPASLLAAVKALNYREKVTPLMTLLAAFKVLLYRYTAQTDLIVGTPFANRERLEAENIFGFFLNTLALRTDLSGHPTFRQVLGRVKAAALEAYSHADVPFEILLAKVQQERDLSHTPLFQVMFVFQDISAEKLDWPGVRTSAWEISTGTAKFDLALILSEIEGQLHAVIEYNTDLFDTATIARLAEHFHLLLENSLAFPDLPISRLPLLPATERHQLLEAWNDTRQEYPLDTCLHHWFEAQVERTPQAIAVSFEGQSLTYRQLNQRANRLAHSLREKGVGPDRLIGICVERSLEMVSGILGVLKAGAAYVPIDPHYPHDRILYMLRDSGSSRAAEEPILLTQRALLEQFTFDQVQAICLDTDQALFDAYPDHNVDSGVQPDNLAYVIYTSGSTGRPKGVMLSHRAICNHMAWMQATFPLTEADRVLQKTPFSFDASVWEFYAPLLAGGQLVMARPMGHQDSAYLVQTIQERQITTLQLVPSLLQMLLEEPGFRNCISLKRVFCGGEALSCEIRDRFFEQLASASLHNLYGPTEATIDSTYYTCPRGGQAHTIPIGRPIHNLRAYILDATFQPVPIGVAGELYIGGAGLGRGYLNRPELTAEKFIPNPFARADAGGQPYAGELRLYRTGDLARYLPDGQIEFLGRADHQLKLRGFRIELGEIEAVLKQDQQVRDALVLIRADSPGDQRLVAYIVPAAGQEPTASDLRTLLRKKLPDYMVPAAFVFLEALPLTPNGKINRQALPAPEFERAETESTPVPPRTEIEQAIAAVWQQVLHQPKVGLHDNFFELGGHSLLLMQVHIRLRELFGPKLSVVDLFHYPTVGALAQYLGQASPAPLPPQRTSSPAASPGGEIAIIGLGCRFPGARNPAEYWHNLRMGADLVHHFSDEELRAAGVEENFLQDPSYVKASPVLEDIESFDAAFFGFTPREAEILDPQQRFFLECAWETLEGAGYDPATYSGRIGVFAGSGLSQYLIRNLLPNSDLLRALGEFQILLSNDKDSLPTRVAYKLNLRGPAVSVGTACSTSLVAVHLACQNLRQGECDLALVGGVTITPAQQEGYLYNPGGIQSPDGYCRAFDAGAQGTVSASGVGIVALKRLEEALADGDPIYAVIKGSAINNDGSLKVGYTAPSVEGQAQVIRRAQEAAGVSAETITYIETHGTGTTLGDPIEIAALTQAFRTATERKNFCAIGSVKTNMGHLDTAAGIAGLIKTALAVKHAEIPASLHFKKPNPKIDFEASPFFVNTALRPWETNEGQPRRAGVSSFGVGGTNAHVILEQPPAPPESRVAAPWQVLPLSARSQAALEAAIRRLGEHLKQNPGINLADVAYTLQTGRHAFDTRAFLVARDLPDALDALEKRDPRRLPTRFQEAEERPIVFLFPGQGAQYLHMGGELYATEAVFRQEVDRCAGVLQPLLGLDLREILYPREEGPTGEGAVAAAERLNQTEFTQPALFVVEYALARLWMAWGLQPQAMIGHSIGEYVAACLAGVFSLEDALRLVATRGQLMQRLPGGSMLAVPLAAEKLQPWLQNKPLSLAAINGPALSVVSGPHADIEALQAALAAENLETQRLRTSHAFHSAMLDPVLPEFAQCVRQAALRAPTLPFISNVTGTWITAGEASDPVYWTRHLRQTVRFSEGIHTLLQESSDWLFLEVGPGRTLSTLTRQQPQAARRDVLTSLRHPQETISDRAFLLESVGRLWLAGVRLNWPALHGADKRQRLPLPTYPFEHQRYWVQPLARLGNQFSGNPLEEPTPPALNFHPRPGLSASYVAPRDELERSLAALWQELLGLQEVGIYDNFFELGGQSLLGTQMLTRVRDAHAVELPLRVLFEAPTVADLALAILQAKAAQTDEEALAQMLDQLEQLSDEDLEKLMSAEGNPS